MNFIQQLDTIVLRFIHVTCGGPLLDQWIPYLRNPFFWAPLYLFLFTFFWKNFGNRGLYWCAFFFITFVFCDYCSASLIKPLFQRLRPCHEQFDGMVIRELIRCGSGYSFPSTHATNHFGMSVFMIFTLRQKYKWIWVWALVWAILVSYAQLYVAAHYFSDIVGGMLLGSGIGLLSSAMFNRRYGLFMKVV